MPQDFRSSTRWAIYFRDGLSCVYCRVTLAELLRRRDGNFLSLDHVQLRSEGGTNEAQNLVTACFACNHSRGTQSIAEFARELGIPRTTLRDRVLARTRRDLEPHRLAAKLALGQRPGFPVAQTVLDHDVLVRAQWQAHDLDVQHWQHLKAEETLFCPHCQRARPQCLGPSVDLPIGDDDIPF